MSETIQFFLGVQFVLFFVFIFFLIKKLSDSYELFQDIERHLNWINQKMPEKRNESN